MLNYANVLFVFVFFCDTSKALKKSDFYSKQSLILSSVCVIVTWRPIGDSSRLDGVQEQQMHVARAIYTCVSFCRVAVFIL